MVSALWVAGSGLALAAANSDVYDLRATLSSPFDSGWVLADFNGDLRLDFASTHVARHDARGYTQEVRVILGRCGQTSFTFHTRTARIELRARDIDGDEDRDIVILEALSKRPVGVWLNDGAGSFEEGDLESFQKSLGGDSASAWRAQPEPRAWCAVVEQRDQAAARSITVIVLDCAAESLVPGGEDGPRDFRGSTIRSRAPPRNS